MKMKIKVGIISLMILLRLAFQTCCASPNTNLTWGHLCSILRSFGCAEFLLLCRWDEIGMQGSYSDICMALRFIIRLPKRATKITQNKQRKSTIFFQGCEDIYTNTYISSICFIESKRLRLFFIITASICYVGTQQTELTQLLSLPLILLLLPNSKLI